MVQRRGEVADIDAAQVARAAIRGQPAALDRKPMGDTGRRPGRHKRIKRGAKGDHIHRQRADPRPDECRGTGGATGFVGGQAAGNAGNGQGAQQQGRADRPVGLRGRRGRPGNEEAGNDADHRRRHGGDGRCHRPQPARRRRAEVRYVATDFFLDQRFDAINQGALGRLCRHQSEARLLLRKSVISMQPGAWVMQNSGFTCAITAWGVTPQAQNTGSSPGPIGTASP